MPQLKQRKCCTFSAAVQSGTFDFGAQHCKLRAPEPFYLHLSMLLWLPALVTTDSQQGMSIRIRWLPHFFVSTHLQSNWVAVCTP